MKANRVIKSTGASLILAALLSAGLMPAHAGDMAIGAPVPPLEPTYGVPVPIDSAPFDPTPVHGGPVGDTYPFDPPQAPGCAPTSSDGQWVGCFRPQLTITQAETTVGKPVLLDGSGFEPSEQVSIADAEGRFNLSTVADDTGSFRYEWSVPGYNTVGNGIMLSATGALSQHATEGVLVQVTPAYISEGDTWGTLVGWYPGEELAITANGAPHPSRFASADGTSSNFDELANDFPGETLIEVHGTQSGGYYSAVLVPFKTGPQPPVEPEPIEEELPEPKLEVTVDVPKTVETVETETSVPPAPVRPQPQAALVSNEAEDMSLASGAVATALLAGPAFLALALLAGPSVLVSGAVSAASAIGAGFLARRLNSKTSGK
ncbi:hypothetical protein ASH00_09015 [Arthrobacter sp. Soil782]|uniref:hypothetical protein n=1 Tax=Arthrobacter sp. Soil782 TaxID=1736410 RepID=UPI0006FEAD9A|nr:hypothetical protein [Arthrobacter sp. Soil782]KRF05597.1 hypothetical protein ASH00_09015 [Arthrobacter sp. Soil782]